MGGRGGGAGDGKSERAELWNTEGGKERKKKGGEGVQPWKRKKVSTSKHPSDEWESRSLVPG